ncbi:MAG TPA: hypothetical protein PKE63_04110 [Lacibacter sp.]|nr:hypothetical protein [Lacibacter sp.]
MTTKNQVPSRFNGTLKTKHLLQSFRTFLSLAALALVSFVTMAFDTEDTTRRMHPVSDAADSCCTYTFVSGGYHITIRNSNSLNSSVLINNMDVQTYVNTLKAYTFKKVNSGFAVEADQTLDVRFIEAEARNRQMAAAFSHEMNMAASAADENLEEMFTTQVAAPLFSRQAAENAADADAGIDQAFNEGVERTARAVAFGKQQEFTAADAGMDHQVLVTGMAPVTPRMQLLREADAQLDEQFRNQPFRTIRPVLGAAADVAMDQNIRKGQ